MPGCSSSWAGMGRTAAGVRGIRLSSDDRVVAVVVLSTESSVLVVTENGFGKRTSIEEYRLQKRGGKGILGMKTLQDDIVEHFLLANTHDSILFFTDKRGHSPWPLLKACLADSNASKALLLISSGTSNFT